MDAKKQKAHSYLLLFIMVVLTAIGCGQGGGSGSAAGNFGNASGDGTEMGNNFAGDNATLNMIFFAASEVGGATAYAESDSFKIVLGEADDFGVVEKQQSDLLDVMMWNEGFESMLEW